jgi:hypothetical protein
MWCDFIKTQLQNYVSYDPYEYEHNLKPYTPTKKDKQHQP